MSIGPAQTEESVGITTLQQARLFFVKSFTGYLEHPAYYLFYGALTATIIGLFCGMSFSGAYYFFLTCLAAFEGWRLYRLLPVAPPK